jgi:phytol kinase
MNTSHPQKLWLGLPPSPADTYDGPWETAEKWTLWLMGFWCLLAALGTAIGLLSSDPSIAAIFALPDDEFWTRLLRQLPLTLVVYVLFGLAVEKLGVNVVYTRKFGHILFIFLFPLLVEPKIVPGDELYRAWYLSVIWYSLLGFIVPFVIMVRPIRSRFRPLYYCLRGFDRPEDRPYTLIWFISQMLAIGLFQMPMTQYFVSQDVWSLYLIAAFANGLGDGLAEPFGKIWGKKKYKVFALFTKREYTRSYVGSATVFAATAMGVLINYTILNSVQFALLIIVMPPLMTLIEAMSPHTWDNVFMYGACWIVIAGALQL